MPDRARLEAMSTPDLIKLAERSGVDQSQIATKADLIAVLLGERPVVEEEPEAEVITLHQPAADQYETDDAGCLTTIGAAKMLADRHVSQIRSDAHRSALETVLWRAMEFEIKRLGKLRAYPDDFDIDTVEVRVGKVNATTTVSLPHADGFGLVVVAGDRHEIAQPTMRYDRLKMRTRRLLLDE